MFSWKPITTYVDDNWNLSQTQIETRNWTCFGQTKIKNSNSIICTIVSNTFPSMFKNISPSLVVMEPQWKLDVWTFDFEWQIVQWISHVDQMMTSITWQFPYFLEWRWNRGRYGLHLGHLKKKGLKQKKNEERGKKKHVKKIKEKNFFFPLRRDIIKWPLDF